jgi:acetyltransferase-like isoleucine patch superfamily enzyme
MMECKRINVEAGEGCEISPYCSLENVVLGRGVAVRDGVQLKNVVAGDGTRFSRNVTFYSLDPARPVCVGRECRFGHGVLGEATGGEIGIGDHVAIGHYSVLLTSSGPAPGPVMTLLYADTTGPIRVGAHGWLGAHSVVLPGVRFEEGVVLGANSLAAEERYEAWSLYGGSPARLLRRLDRQRVEEAIRQWRDRLS